jgi:RNA polymerase sigma-70 factor (ECF subfamily)
MAKRLSDAELLERFVNCREETAFVTLVERHGQLVEGVCRRVLRDAHDVEDVCQATFLVLAQKAPQMAWRESVGGWLRAVAHRLALHARAEVGRRRTREAVASAVARSAPQCRQQEGSLLDLPERYHPFVDPAVDMENRDLRHLIEDELGQMPEKYRAAVVLCDLEGRTHQEAARRLGWPAGSMSRRLQRARVLLKQRLESRGISWGIVLVGIGIAIWGIKSIPPENRRAGWEVRRAMALLKPQTVGGHGLESTLADLVGGKRDVAPAQLAKLSEEAAEVAAQLERHRPAKQPDQWSQWAVEMRQSAMQLALVSRESDDGAILAAARRLNSTCIKCHEVFCQ